MLHTAKRKPVKTSKESQNKVIKSSDLDFFEAPLKGFQFSLKRGRSVSDLNQLDLQSFTGSSLVREITVESDIYRKPQRRFLSAPTSFF